MLGFMDESGDTGFRFERNSSPYFVVTLLLVPNEEEAERLRRTMEELKTALRKPSIELHFTNTDDRTRRAFFSAIKPHDFQVVAAVCRKRSVQSLQSSHSDFLLSAFGAVLEHARDQGLLTGANIKYDEAGGSAFQKKLSSQLLARVNGMETGRYVKRCEPQSSDGNNLIQLVDMICGAIARPYNKPHKAERDYLETIKHRITSVLEWP